MTIWMPKMTIRRQNSAETAYMSMPDDEACAGADVVGDDRQAQMRLAAGGDGRAHEAHQNEQIGGHLIGDCQRSAEYA